MRGGLSCGPAHQNSSSTAQGKLQLGSCSLTRQPVRGRRADSSSARPIPTLFEVGTATRTDHDFLRSFLALSRELASSAERVQGLVDDPEGSHLPLVLCGSSQRMMQGLVLDRAAPLYGRSQLLLRLEPLSVGELGPALGVDTPMAIVETFAAWGGVPRYWELAARQKGSLWEAVTSLVLSPSGILHEEASRVLRDEGAATQERALCQAIGLGAHRPSELAGRLGTPATSLSKPLRHLVELGLVRRDAPYDFRKGIPSRSARSSLYALADPFLSMWYRCVHPYLSGLELEAPVARRRAQEAWRHHVGAVWEELVRRHWHHMAMNNLEWEVAGRSWEGRKTTGREWDVVSVTSDRRTVMLGECKWHRKLSQRDLSRIVRDMTAKTRPPEAACRKGCRRRTGDSAPRPSRCCHPRVPSL